MTFVVLGCGFTGARVARLLSERGERVIATLPGGDWMRAEETGALPLRLDADEPGSREGLARRCAAEGGRVRLLVAFPPARLADGAERTRAVLAPLAGGVERVVLLSSTVVYGRAGRVDETTAADPVGPRGALQVEAEQAVLGGPWSSLVLRAAAIYGPGRGLLAEGGPRLTHARSLDAVVSRIHADDLAALAVAALRGDLRGAFPVADEEPASGRALLAALAGGEPPPPPGEDPPGSRRVDGAAIRRLLGVLLRYPSFRDALRS